MGMEGSVKIVTVLCLVLVASVAICARSAGAAQLVNGDFETGDFTGWTLFDTAHGGSIATQVISFDTTNTGIPSLGASFAVGQTSGTIGGGGLGEGAGILQNVSRLAGQLK